MMAERKVDVFIAGAGPVGLLLAYQLAKFGVSTYLIDAADKASPQFPMYGRACTLMRESKEVCNPQMQRLTNYQLAHVSYWTN